MWDSIFILIHHFSKPYKKKDLHYLLNSRLNNLKKRDLIIFHDINIKNKCNQCSDFQPWVLLKNCGEGIFLLKKFVEKFKPWITITLQTNLYDFNYKKDDKIDNIFALITKIKSRNKLYELINENSKFIINQDIRLKNNCKKCEDIYPWLIIEHSKKGLEFAQQIYENSKPFIILKKQRIIYEHNIPKVIQVKDKWTKKEELIYGRMRIEI
ncbi:MAG: hypothetical protein ACP6IY_18400 [Promethearchaeia archaeon]